MARWVFAVDRTCVVDGPAPDDAPSPCLGDAFNATLDPERSTTFASANVVADQ